MSMTIKQRIFTAGFAIFLIFILFAIINLRMHQEVLSNLATRDEVSHRLRDIQAHIQWKNDLIMFVSDVASSGHVPSFLNNRIELPAEDQTKETKKLVQNAQTLISLFAEREKRTREINAKFESFRNKINSLHYKLDKKISTVLAIIQMDQVIGKDSPEQVSLAPYVLKSLNQLTLIALDSIISRNYDQEDRGSVARNKQFLSSQLKIIDKDGSIAELFNELFSQISLLKQFIPESKTTILDLESEIEKSKMLFNQALTEPDLNQRISEAESESKIANTRLENASRRTFITAIIFLIVIPLTAILFGVFGLNRLIVRPISHLVNAMKDVENGNFDVTAKIKTKDEIGKLSEAFNTMASEINTKVTDLAILNKSLKESESKYRTLVENLPQGIFMKNLNLEYISCNHIFALDIGLPEPEIFGKTDHDLFSKKQADHIRTEDERILSNAALEEIERSFIKNGKTYFILMIKTPVWDEHGEVCGVLGIYSDITERKHADAERARLMSAIEQLTEIVVVTDPNSVIQYVNPAFEKVTGYGPDEVKGQTPRILKSGEQNDAFYRQLWETITSGEAWQGKIVNRKKDGSLYTEEATISPVVDETGDIVNFVAVKRDITSEVAMEAMLTQAQKMEAVGRLAGGVAHDLNNLLSPILGYGEMLADDFPAGDKRRESAEAIVSAGYRARDLVRQLLAFSRKQPLEIRTLDPNRVMKDFETLLRRTLREDIQIDMNLPPGLPPICADVGQIEQVIMNLAVNAQDAMPDGGTLTIESGMVDLDETYAGEHHGVTPGPYVLLAVSDTGHGMDTEILGRVFEPFYTTKERGKGTGLGLSTVYGIVKQHGGNVWVYSEPGKGTTFKCYFPAVESRNARPDEPQDVTAQDLCGSETVLIAEDDESVRKLAVSILKRKGYEVYWAANGHECLKLFQEKMDSIHLLITDVIMPDMNGKELYERISELKSGIKVLYASGYTDNVIAHHGVLDKGIHFIQKPFSIQGLSAKVRKVLDEREG